MSVSSSYGSSPSSPRVSVGLGSCSTRALAVVTNKWYREQRRAEQDVTRSLTLLKQRKISCILKVRIFPLFKYLVEIRLKEQRCAIKVLIVCFPFGLIIMCTFWFEKFFFLKLTINQSWINISKLANFWKTVNQKLYQAIKEILF